MSSRTPRPCRRVLAAPGPFTELLFCGLVRPSHRRVYLSPDRPALANELLGMARSIEIDAPSSWHRLFLPDKVITTGATALTNAGRAVPVYAAARIHPECSGAARRARSHHQIALRPDRSCKPVSRVSRIIRTSSHDVERPRSPIWTLGHLPTVGHVRGVYIR
jgi:hypothetical protein